MYRLIWWSLLILILVLEIEILMISGQIRSKIGQPCEQDDDCLSAEHQNFERCVLKIPLTELTCQCGYKNASSDKAKLRHPDNYKLIAGKDNICLGPPGYPCGGELNSDFQILLNEKSGDSQCASGVCDHALFRCHDFGAEREGAESDSYSIHSNSCSIVIFSILIVVAYAMVMK